MQSLFRIIKFSFQDIARNVWLTIVTITILLLALLSINTLEIVRVISDNAVGAVKEKINISLYLKAEAPEEEILALRESLLSSERVKSVSYISRQKALENFREKYKNNQEVLNALKELGRNPLSPSLTILPQNFEESGLLINELRVLDNAIIESRDFLITLVF